MSGTDILMSNGTFQGQQIPFLSYFFTYCKATNKVKGSINKNSLQINFKTHGILLYPCYLFSHISRQFGQVEKKHMDIK